MLHILEILFQNNHFFILKNIVHLYKRFIYIYIYIRKTSLKIKYITKK
jgi:hypothetical protein